MTSVLHPFTSRRRRFMPEEDMDMPPTRCRLSAVRDLIKVCQSLSLALAASSRHRSRLDITAKSGRCACMLFNSRTRSHVFLSPFLITAHAMPMLSLLQLSTSELSVVRLKVHSCEPRSRNHRAGGALPDTERPFTVTNSNTCDGEPGCLAATTLL